MVAGEVARIARHPARADPACAGQRVRDGTADDGLPGGRVGRVPGDARATWISTCSTSGSAPCRRRRSTRCSVRASRSGHRGRRTRGHPLPRPDPRAARPVRGVTRSPRRRSSARSRAFEDTYEDIYTIRLLGGVPEMVSLRVIGLGRTAAVRAGGSQRRARRRSRPAPRATCSRGTRWRAVDVYRRYDLAPGTSLRRARDPRGGGLDHLGRVRNERATIDAQGNLLITHQRGARAGREPTGSPRRWPDMATIETAPGRGHRRGHARGDAQRLHPGLRRGHDHACSRRRTR